MTSLAANSRTPAGAYQAPSVQTKTEQFDNPYAPLYGIPGNKTSGCDLQTKADPRAPYRDDQLQALVMGNGSIRCGLYVFYGNPKSIRVRCKLDKTLSLWQAGGTTASYCRTRLVRYDLSRPDTSSFLWGDSTGQQIQHELKVQCQWNSTQGIYESSPYLTTMSGPAPANGVDNMCDYQADIVFPSALGFGVYMLQCLGDGPANGPKTGLGWQCIFDNIEGMGRTWRFADSRWQADPSGEAHSTSKYPPGTSFLIGGNWTDCTSTTMCPVEPPPVPMPVPTCTSSTALTASQIAAIVKQVGFDGDGAVTATAIALAVSGGQVNFVGASGSGGDSGHRSLGLFGVSTFNSQFDRTRLVSDAAYNGASAFVVSNGGTAWSAWSSYSTAYTAKMTEARAAVQGAPYSGSILCRGSMNGVPTTSDPAGPWVEDDGDGETGCGFTLNVVAAFGCVLRWAFVPRTEKLTESKDSFVNSGKQTLPGSYMAEAGDIWSGVKAAATHPNATPPKLTYNAPNGQTVDVVFDPNSVGLNGTGDVDDNPSGSNDGFLPIRYLITAGLWVAVAARMWRTLPWSKGRDSGELG